MQCGLTVFPLPVGGSVPVSVPLHQSSGQSADVEQSSIPEVAPGGPAAWAEGAAPWGAT